MTDLVSHFTLAHMSESDLIKKPHTTETYTPEMLNELALSAGDPVHFIKTHMYIQHPTKGRLKFALFDYQEELIRTYDGYRNSISLLSRQTGKSTCAAGYLLWYAMFKPDSTILIAAHKHAGAQEIMQRIRYMYENLPNYLRAGATNYNKGSIDFDNGSRIVSATTTENTGRGMSLTLVYCLDGETTVKVRDKRTLVEEEITLADLYSRLDPTARVVV